MMPFRNVFYQRIRINNIFDNKLHKQFTTFIIRNQCFIKYCLWIYTMRILFYTKPENFRQSIE